MRALVTGASGFIGSHIVRRLLAEGFEVRAQVRPTSNLYALEGLDVELSRGDVRDLDSMRQAVRDCEVVFHAAALYAFWNPDVHEFYRTNVLGTRNVLTAAMEAGVERVVHTSSVATISPPPPGKLSDENTPLNTEDIAGPYKRSKHLAEKEALRFCEKGLEVVIVNPTTPVGSFDHKPTPTGKMILDFLRGRMFAYIETGLNLIAVEDVAWGHLLALRRGRPGERYILGHKNLKLIEIFKVLSQITGLPAPRLKLPYHLILASAHIDELLRGKLLRIPPRIPLEAVRTARKPLYVSCQKAIRELGLPQTPVKKALEQAVCWFYEHGYVKGKKREAKYGKAIS